MKNFSLWSILIVALSFCIVGCREEKDPGAIAGFVTDANSGEPLRAVDITLSPTGLSTVSGSDGRYEFHNLDPDQYTVRASKSGYISNSRSVSVVSGQTASGDIMLTASSADMSLSVGLVDFGTSGTVEVFQIINNASTGSFQWTVSKEGVANWLTVTPTSGSVGAGQRAPVTLTVDRSQVSTSQTVTLRVTNTTSGNSISLPVSVGYNSGTLQVTPSTVDFGTSATSRQLTLYNSGSTIVTYEVNYNCSWLTVSPTSGTLASGSSATLALSLNRSAFSGNAETILQVRNTADGSSTSVRVIASNNGSSPSDDIVVSNGLMAYYTFDDGTANDKTDNGADAQMMSGATTATETGGRVYLKISSTQASYLNIPYNFFSGYSYWTVSFWVKDLTAGCVFAAVNSNNNNGYDQPCLWADQGGQLIVYLKSDYYHSDISYNYVNNSSVWHHYTIVRDGGSTGNQVPVKFYVDGVLIDNLSVSSTTTNGTKIIFGGDKNGSYGIAPSMKLDNIRFYGRALSSSEIQTIYNNEQ